MERSYTIGLEYNFSNLPGRGLMLKEDQASFRVDRDFEVLNEKIERAKGMQEGDQAALLRKRKLNDASNKFVIDTAKKVMHDRGCQCVKKIADADFDMSAVYIKNIKTCEHCRDVALIRNCIDDVSDLKMVVAFFRKLNPDFVDLRTLCTDKNVTIKAIATKIIEMKVNEDTWRLEISHDGYFRTLMHNNYLIVDHKRVMQPGFHVHFRRQHEDFREIINYVRGYRPNYHVNRVIRGEAEALKLAPENDLGIPRMEELFNIPNVARLKKFKLFYDRYMYIDTIRDYGSEVFGKYDIKVKQIDRITRENIPFTIVVCDIPKWQRKKIFKAMSRIKSKMFKNGFSDVYLCSLTMFRYFDKCGIKYTTDFRRKKSK